MIFLIVYCVISFALYNIMAAQAIHENTGTFVRGHYGGKEEWDYYESNEFPKALILVIFWLPILPYYLLLQLSKTIQKLTVWFLKRKKTNITTTSSNKETLLLKTKNSLILETAANESWNLIQMITSVENAAPSFQKNQMIKNCLLMTQQ